MLGDRAGKNADKPTPRRLLASRALSFCIRFVVVEYLCRERIRKQCGRNTWLAAGSGEWKEEEEESACLGGNIDMFQIN